MILIDNLSDAASQVTVVQMSNGTTGTLRLQYRPTIQRWTFDLTHAEFPGGQIQGQMMCVHPNILRNFKNLLSFGMACVSNDGSDPVNIEDFASGRALLYILDASDVAAVESALFGITA